MKVKLFGECVCGKTLTAEGDLPEFKFSDGKHEWKALPHEHLVTLCNQCGRLVNLT